MTSSLLKNQGSPEGKYVAGLLFLYLFVYDHWKLEPGGLKLQVYDGDGRVIHNDDTKYPREYIRYYSSVLNTIVGMHGLSASSEPAQVHEMRMIPEYHRVKLDLLHRAIPAADILTIVRLHMDHEIEELVSSVTGPGAVSSVHPCHAKSLVLGNPTTLKTYQTAVTNCTYHCLFGLVEC